MTIRNTLPNSRRHRQAPRWVRHKLKIDVCRLDRAVPEPPAQVVDEDTTGQKMQSASLNGSLNSLSNPGIEAFAFGLGNRIRGPVNIRAYSKNDYPLREEGRQRDLP